METIIARQPIFDAQRRLFAYELLYRGVDLQSLTAVGGNRATSSLLTSSFLTKGLEQISANKPCCVNFTEDLLLARIAENFPAKSIIVEILEDVRPSDEVVAECRKLKEQGYQLALDDFVYAPALLPLLELADIIKIDLQHLPLEQLGRTLENLVPYPVELLAEKIETYQQFQEARRLGFHYFQGFFFARPEEMRIREMTATRLSLLKLLLEINRDSISTARLAEIIAAEASLSYRLLRYINSAYYYLVTEVHSIHHAVAYLGQDEIRRFATLAIISEISANKPAELVRLATIRAKFCELLGMESTKEVKPQELFLLGLFSLLDAMLDCPMEEAIGRIPVSHELRQALTGRGGPFRPFLEVAAGYERCEASRCGRALQDLGVVEDRLFPIYLAALKFADSLISL